MLYTLKNDTLTVQVNSFGAELTSVCRGECEYVWNADPKYWDGHAPMLFPICGRVYQGKYTYEGKTYEMDMHGFAWQSEFEAEQESDTCVRFTLNPSESTRAQYPFEFRFVVTYVLEGDTLHTYMNIQNTGDKILPATAGGHPGFNVPLDGKGSFEDYYVEFSETCSPDEMLLGEVCYFSGKKRGMNLEEGKRISLTRAMFDDEGVFMSRVPNTITLKSDKTERFVTVRYDDMPYLGIWQEAKIEPPFVCIEPWCGFADYAGAIGDIMQKADMFRILPGAEKTVSYSIQFG